MASFSDAIQAAAGIVGNLIGNVTGNLIGNVTGNVVGNLTGNVVGNLTGGNLPPSTSLSGDGAIAIPAASRDFPITKSSAAALTIAAPVSGTDDNKLLTIWDTTGHAHVVTCASDGFNAKGSSGTLTFGGAIGDAVILKAFSGHWYTVSLNAVTPA